MAWLIHLPKITDFSVGKRLLAVDSYRFATSNRHLTVNVLFEIRIRDSFTRNSLQIGIGLTLTQATNKDGENPTVFGIDFKGLFTNCAFTQNRRNRDWWNMYDLEA